MEDRYPCPRLYRQLKEYSGSGRYPFHMPGHKRRTDAGAAAAFPNPYSIDITEIDGFDNLHHAEGILKESMEWAASVYGADRTYYLVNGSSCGVLAAICAAAEPGGTLVMARNSHKSAYHGAALGRLNVRYVYPQIIDGFGLQGGLRPEDVEAALKDVEAEQMKTAGTGCKKCVEGCGSPAVFVTSPTYDGVVSDIGRIAEICHRRGAPLIVDEAHGAHFPFGEMFPASALDKGADIVIQSLHKTLPALTQTALLHVREGLIDTERLEYYLQVFESSSPSYVLMAGIERCIEFMADEGRREMERFGKRLDALRGSLGKMRNLRLLDRQVIGHAGVYDLDISKVVVSAGRTGQAEPPEGNVSGAAAPEENAGVAAAQEGDVRRAAAPEEDAGVAAASEEDAGRVAAPEGNVSDAAAQEENAGSAAAPAISGTELAGRLRNEYGLEMEMCGADYVTAIATLMDTDEGMKRLEAALLAIDRSLDRPAPETTRGKGQSAEQDRAAKAGSPAEQAQSAKALPPAPYSQLSPPLRALPVWEALNAPAHPVPVERSAGRISAEYVFLYPPGTPIIVPGEVISQETADRICVYRAWGLPIQGLRDHTAVQIYVIS